MGATAFDESTERHVPMTSARDYHGEAAAANARGAARPPAGRR